MNHLAYYITLFIKFDRNVDAWWKCLFPICKKFISVKYVIFLIFRCSWDFWDIYKWLTNVSKDFSSQAAQPMQTDLPVSTGQASKLLIDVTISDITF